MCPIFSPLRFASGRGGSQFDAALQGVEAADDHELQQAPSHPWRIFQGVRAIGITYWGADAYRVEIPGDHASVGSC